MLAASPSLSLSLRRGADCGGNEIVNCAFALRPNADDLSTETQPVDDETCPGPLEPICVSDRSDCHTQFLCRESEFLLHSKRNEEYDTDCMAAMANGEKKISV